MQSEVIDERPDCYQVLEERDQWITSLDNIEKTEEYKEFVDRLHNNSITDESLVKYAKYHLEFLTNTTISSLDACVSQDTEEERVSNVNSLVAKFERFFRH